MSMRWHPQIGIATAWCGANRLAEVSAGGGSRSLNPAKVPVNAAGQPDG
jgi:hypothetical protein